MDGEDGREGKKKDIYWIIPTTSEFIIKLVRNDYWVKEISEKIHVNYITLIIRAKE